MAMITRREGESEFEFFKRIIRGKLVDKTITEDWEDLSELLFGEGNCFNSSEVRKRAYGANRAIDLIEKEGVDKLLAERNEIMMNVEYDTFNNRIHEIFHTFGFEDIKKWKIA